jgi:CRP-like cAMP-binding protein
MQRTYKYSDIEPTRAAGAIATTLRKAGRRKRFRRGATIQQKGDAGGGFWLIDRGQVMVCRHGGEGHLTIYAVLGPGDLFGELAYFAGVPRQVDAMADSDAELIRIDSALINQLLAREPDFAQWLLKSLANQLRVALDRIEQDRSQSAERRLALTLADMARRDGQDAAITQQQLADLVGVSRVTAGKALERFERAGLVSRGYRQIRVTNANALAAWDEHEVAGRAPPPRAAAAAGKSRPG